MGQQFQFDGALQEHRPGKTIEQLKDEMGVPDSDFLIYDAGDGGVMLSDKDTVGDIPTGASVTTIPKGGELSG
jgi:hypothetical protein